MANLASICRSNMSPNAFASVRKTNKWFSIGPSKGVAGSAVRFSVPGRNASIALRTRFIFLFFTNKSQHPREMVSNVNSRRNQNRNRRWRNRVQSRSNAIANNTGGPTSTAQPINASQTNVEAPVNVETTSPQTNERISSHWYKKGRIHRVYDQRP